MAFRMQYHGFYLHHHNERTDDIERRHQDYQHRMMNMAVFSSFSAE